MGIGSVFGSISSGIDDYQDKLDSKRLKNLEFVRTVMRDNPNMKSSDLIKLRNQLAGNSQFLTEAMPDQLMEAYAQKSADAKADEDLKRELNGIEANKRRDEYYMTIAPDVMGGELPDTEALTKLREALPESARPDFDSRFTPRFSGARKNWATQQAENAIIKMNQMGFDWGNEAGINDVIKGLPAAARPYAQGLVNEKKAAHARQREDQDRRWTQEADLRREGWKNEAELRQKQWDKELETRRLQNERDDRIRQETYTRQEQERIQNLQRTLTDKVLQDAKPIFSDISLDDAGRKAAISQLIDTWKEGMPPEIKLDPSRIFELGKTEIERTARAAQEKQNAALASQSLSTLEASFEQNKKVFGSKENLDSLRKSVDSDQREPAVSALGVLLGETHPNLMPNLNQWIKEAAAKGARNGTDIISAVKARPEYQTYQGARTALSTSSSTVAPLTSKQTVETAAQDAPKIGSLATELGAYAIGTDADPARVTKSKALLLKSVNETIATLERTKVQNQRGATAITSYEDLNAQLAEHRRLLAQINAIPVPSATATPKTPAKTSAVSPTQSGASVAPPASVARPTSRPDLARAAETVLEHTAKKPANAEAILANVAQASGLPPQEIAAEIERIRNTPVELPVVAPENNSELLRAAQEALDRIQRDPSKRDAILKNVARQSTFPVDELQQGIEILQGG